LVAERRVTREELIQAGCLVVDERAQAEVNARLGQAQSSQRSSAQQDIPRGSCGRFEARVLERAEVLCDFKAGNEESHGVFPYSRIQFYKDGRAITWRMSLEVLASNTADANDFRNLHALIFAGGNELNPFEDYFWECNPVSLHTLDSTVYEFVLIHATLMHEKETNPDAFNDKFVNHMGTLDCLQFMTPSPPPKGTNLLAPSRAPGTDLPVYRSMGSFFRGAPEQQLHNMLHLLGSHMPERMRARGDPTLPLWLSTAGYDIAWLHIRLDDKPKYYRFKEYKTPKVVGVVRSLSEAAFSACVVEAGTTACDFKTGNEESHGVLPFTRVRFYKGGIPLMWGEVLETWSGDTVANKSLDLKDVAALRSLTAQVFAGCFWNSQEVFWECRPVTQDTLMTTVFEFVGIIAAEMHKKPTDGNAFSDKFVNHMGTLDCLEFMTPSPPPKETNLLAPSRAPGTELRVYRSFGSFFKGAPKQQVNNMLELLGKHIPERMTVRGNRSLPLYVSTAGYDIAWVHLRLDNVPKYYRFKEYKDELTPES